MPKMMRTQFLRSVIAPRAAPHINSQQLRGLAYAHEHVVREELPDSVLTTAPKGDNRADVAKFFEIPGETAQPCLSVIRAIKLLFLVSKALELYAFRG